MASPLPPGQRPTTGNILNAGGLQALISRMLQIADRGGTWIGNPDLYAYLRRTYPDISVSTIDTLIYRGTRSLNAGRIVQRQDPANRPDIRLIPIVTGRIGGAEHVTHRFLYRVLVTVNPNTERTRQFTVYVGTDECCSYGEIENEAIHTVMARLPSDRRRSEYREPVTEENAIATVESVTRNR